MGVAIFHYLLSAIRRYSSFQYRSALLPVASPAAALLEHYAKVGMEYCEVVGKIDRFVGSDTDFDRVWLRARFSDSPP